LSNSIYLQPIDKFNRNCIYIPRDDIYETEIYLIHACTVTK